MEMEQEEERLNKFTEEARMALPKGWNNPLRILELYKENIKIWAEKKDMGRELDDLVVKAKILLGAKVAIIGGVEKKTRGNLVKETWRLYDQQ